MLRVFFFLLLGFNSSLSFSQEKADYIWVLGHGSVSSDTKDGVILDFNHNPVKISYFPKQMFMNGSNTSICDSMGNLLFYTGGCYVVNSENELLENGDSLSPGLLARDYCPSLNSPLPQGTILLPKPETPNHYYLFNKNLEAVIFDSLTAEGTVTTTKLYSHLIKPDLDLGNYQVSEKLKTVIADTMPTENLQAVRHANGKDWWLITPEYVSNCYYIIRITKDGIHSPKKQCIGKIWNEKDWAGQAVFSPDGKRYVRFNGFNGLNIFDFDRCSGELSNPLIIPFDSIILGGVAISSNSRFLYTSTSEKMHQFDLEEGDIGASKILVGEFDGFANPFAANFYLAQLAPDEKIYLAGTSSLKNLHVINKPNEKGLACDFVPHGIDLPVNNVVSIPNFPHYRLGASEETCDFSVNTIEASSNMQKIEFFPNPASNFITLKVPLPFGKYNLKIFSVTKQKVLELQNLKGEETIPLNIPNGIYFCTLLFENGKIEADKLIIGK